MKTLVKQCSHWSCDRKHYGKGLCSSHYQQQRKGFPLTPLKNRGENGACVSMKDKHQAGNEVKKQVAEALGRSEADASIWLWLQSDIDHHLWLMDKIVVNDDGCWVWQGYCESGYGRIKLVVGDVHFNKIKVHRIAFALEYGFEALPVWDRKDPDPLTLDHRCRNTRCCHPQHLEVVTQSVNQRRRTMQIPKSDWFVS